MVEYKHLGVILVIISIAAGLIAFVSQQPGGYITTKGGSVCSWRVEGDATTERAVSFECTSGAIKYSCKYQARPDVDCPPFWRDIFGYFKQLRERVKSDKHACDSSQFTIPLCEKHEDFKIKRIGDPTPSDLQ